VTPAQCKTARFLLGWSAERLANVIGVSPTTVRNFERGVVTRTQRHVLQEWKRAFIREGVVFGDPRAPKAADPFSPVKHVELEDGSTVSLTDKPV